jgi:S1-C subfamily serine protease
MRKLPQLLFYGLILSVFIALGFILAVSFVPSLTNQELGAIEDAPAPVSEADPALAAQEEAFGEIYRAVAPSVVAITIYARPDEDTAWLALSGGSGFMVDTDGHIVTNYHVVLTAIDIEELIDEGAEALIEVRMFDGTIVEGQIVGTDANADIAVISVDVSSDRLHPVAWGDSEAMHEGQMVFALGNPYANDWTLTSGIVSAINRSIPGLASYSIGGVIQTDAAINPGNSGGPLVNLTGEVVGVNSQIVTENGSNSGIGFAVPSNLVIKVAQSLIEDGNVEYSFMGIESRPIDLTLINDYELPNNLRGVAISAVRPNTPAADAGLERPSRSSIDVITAINGEPLEDFDEMIGYLSIHTNPGDTVILTIYRAGEILEIPLILAERPS